MPSALDLRIHRSQFPAQVTADLVTSLNRRQMAHKFHYDSQRQARKWLEIHEQYSPARTDPNCLAVYDRAFEHVTKLLPNNSLQLISLGCGGGHKDAGLCRKLLNAGIKPNYLPLDVSPDLVISSWLKVSEHLQSTLSLATDRPLGCVGDLTSNINPLTALLELADPEMKRLIAFLGMMPNFEPDQFLPRLAAMLRKDDLCLMSVNLAPGDNYQAGVEQVLPLYDNPATTEWLGMILEELGLEPGAGHLDWSIKPCPIASGLLRLQADFQFDRPQILHAGDESIAFKAGDIIQLFYSYRHTLDNLRSLLPGYGIEMVESWVTKSGEEAVFLCRHS